MRAIGNKGEDFAVKILKKEGYEIIERNFTIRGGEIDIIARDGEYLVFVEVKLRKSVDFGRPSEFVTKAKREHIIHTASTYLSIYEIDLPTRFDVVEIIAKEGKWGKLKVEEYTIIKDAFTC